MPKGEIHSKGETSLSEILDKFKEKLGDEVGAIASFVGIVRRNAKEGGKVRKLDYESADSADEELENIAEDMEEKEGISEVAIHHVIDELEPRDDIIYVLAGGGHREDVFDVLPEIM
ncbi:MAG: molybdenum cofactor biosynthesis protein MoaE, partial [Candidatus Aenigmatarchaeota archaeon]